jgi:hypothetical protein
MTFIYDKDMSIVIKIICNKLHKIIFFMNSKLYNLENGVFDKQLWYVLVDITTRALQC